MAATDPRNLNPDQLSGLSNDELLQVTANLVRRQEDDRRENQLLYYRPASPEAAKVHDSTAKVIGIGGGNGSSKTETMIVEMMSLATGIRPLAMDEEKWRKKFIGPSQQRLVVESLTTTLETIILPKLKWWHWTGLKPQGGTQGHWGWIPRRCLKGGTWDRAWSAKLRTLTVLCYDPDDPERLLGETTIQCMSQDQDPTDFASGDFDFVGLDEPPSESIYTENEARTMRVGGRIMLAMTWPDDPSIPVDWIFDKVYEKGLPGPNKSPNVDWFNLYTTDNPHIDQDAVALQASEWSDEMQKVRIHGQPIRFSNRIHPLYTDVVQWWCFRCMKSILPLEGKCSTCGSVEVAHYCHVTHFDAMRNWPTLFVLDPHPRKPHMWMWVQVDPSDDLWQVAEDELDGDCTQVWDEVKRKERLYELNVTYRLIDPNMGASPASTKREITWQDEFDAAGLHCQLADDSGVGRKRINTFLQPDKFRQQPRMHISTRCSVTTSQFKRYTWAEYKRSPDRDVKQTPKDKNDDYPTMWKYVLNLEPTFRFMQQGPSVIHTRSRHGKKDQGPKSRRGASTRHQ